MVMVEAMMPPKNLVALWPFMLNVPVPLSPARTLKVVADVAPAVIVCL